MPTGVRRKGKRFVAFDKNTGKVLTKPTTKGKAAAFGRIRDQADKGKKKG